MGCRREDPLERFVSSWVQGSKTQRKDWARGRGLWLVIEGMVRINVVFQGNHRGREGEGLAGVW